MTQTSPRRPSPGGFTLVELLVVIGIIALLISILLPSLNRARASSREIVCQNNLRQFGIGTALYVAAANGKLPFDGGDGTDAATPVGKWSDPSLWFNAIPQALNSISYDEMQLDARNGGEELPPGNGKPSVFICPDADVAVGHPTKDTVVDGYFQMYGIEPDGTVMARPQFICYAYNSKLISGTNPAPAIGRIRGSSEVVLLTEKRTRAGEVTAADDAYYQAQGGQAGRLTGRDIGRLKADWQRYTTRHFPNDPKRRGGNLLFVDGHVARASMQEVLTSSPESNPADWNHYGTGGPIWSYEGPALK